MAVFICTLIFKISRMHTCIPVVCVYIYIYVWGGGGCGLGWGDVVMCVCVSERKMYSCAHVLIAIVLICV